MGNVGPGRPEPPTRRVPEPWGTDALCGQNVKEVSTSRPFALAGPWVEDSGELGPSNGRPDESPGGGVRPPGPRAPGGGMLPYAQEGGAGASGNAQGVGDNPGLGSRQGCGGPGRGPGVRLPSAVRWEEPGGGPPRGSPLECFPWTAPKGGGGGGAASVAPGRIAALACGRAPAEKAVGGLTFLSTERSSAGP